MGTDYYVDTTYSYGAASALTGVALVFLIVAWVISLAAVVLMLISMWKIFKKAGKPGWASLIPIYNIYIMTTIAEKEWWYILLLCVPIANIYAMFVIYDGIAKKFGKSTGFTIGMMLLPIPFFPILAFGKSTETVETIETLSNPVPNVDQLGAAPAAPVMEEPVVAPIATAAPTFEEPVAAPVAPVMEEPVVAPMETAAPTFEEPVAAPVTPVMEEPVVAPMETAAPTFEEPVAAPVAPVMEEPVVAPIATAAPTFEQPVAAPAAPVMEEPLQEEQPRTSYFSGHENATPSVEQPVMSNDQPAVMPTDQNNGNIQ